MRGFGISCGAQALSLVMPIPRTERNRSPLIECGDLIPGIDRMQAVARKLSPQNDNVLFAQSRNVLLTPSSWGGGRRTTTNDASRTGPPSGPEEGEEEADHPEAGSRRTGDNGAACETVTAGVEAPGRQGCGSRPTRTSVQPQAQCRYRTRGDGHSRAAGVSRVRAHTGCGVPGEETQDRREPGDRAAVDD